MVLYVSHWFFQGFQEGSDTGALLHLSGLTAQRTVVGSVLLDLISCFLSFSLLLVKGNAN
jgi:hypothetical protein